MDKLLMSRKQKEENTERLTNLSPQKYGKGAFFEMTFTPSKLADNVLYRQASNLKRVEEETSKCRQFQAQNNILLDQVLYLKKQRDGISDSLNQIITMYKKILAQMQVKNEERIRDIQKKFKDEMQRYIKDKEEEAKYFQSEKQILQERIQDLEKELNSVKEELVETKSHKDDANNELDKINIEHKHLQQKFAESESRSKQNAERAQKDYDALKKQFMHAEVQWKNHLNEQLHKKNKQIESLERTHRAEQQKLQTQRNNETILKNQEINELTKAFEFESNRLNDILVAKDKLIDSLSLENNKQKTRILNLTRDYETEISHLAHQKNRLIDQLEHLGRQNQLLAKDKMLISGDLDRQNINLRDLLYQSSIELEKCKNEFLDLAKQNTTLLGRLKSAEEQAKTWRDSYYLNKNRY